MRPIATGASMMLLVTLMTGAACSREEGDGRPAGRDQSGPAQAEAGAPGSDSASADSSRGAPADPAPDLRARLALGAASYEKAQCATCHGPDGKGTRFGPDLTDASWIHCDGSVQGIHGVIITGIPVEEIKNPKYEMKMSPVTKYITDEDQILALAQYIHSLSRH